MTKENKWVGWILVVVGLAYTLLPHSFHMRYGIDFGLTHNMHGIIGVGILVLAYWLYKKGTK